MLDSRPLIAITAAVAVPLSLPVLVLALSLHHHQCSYPRWYCHQVSCCQPS